MIERIAWGINDNMSYFVQQCCNEEHKGQQCDCKILYDNVAGEEQAKKLAKTKAKELGVKCVEW